MITVKGVMSYTIIKVPHHFTVSHATACNKQVHEKVGFFKNKTYLSLHDATRKIYIQNINLTV